MKKKTTTTNKQKNNNNPPPTPPTKKKKNNKKQKVECLFSHAHIFSCTPFSCLSFFFKFRMQTAFQYKNFYRFLQTLLEGIQKWINTLKSSIFRPIWPLQYPVRKRLTAYFYDTILNDTF